MFFEDICRLNEIYKVRENYRYFRVIVVYIVKWFWIVGKSYGVWIKRLVSGCDEGNGLGF